MKTSENVPRASIDSFVFLAATPWETDQSELVQQAFAETWAEPISISLTDGVGEAVFEDEEAAQIVVEERIPELVELSGSSIEPYGPSALVMLEQHKSVWRCTIPSQSGPREAAIRASKLMSGLVEAGASGILIPMTMRLHSPRSIRVITMNPEQEDALANLFVHAWHSEGWMRTRGLTAFGMPELDTSTDQGLNGAYFCLMDVAANMIQRGSAFMPGSQLEVGPRLLRIALGPSSPEDQEMPIAGHFGVQTLQALA